MILPRSEGIYHLIYRFFLDCLNVVHPPGYLHHSQAYRHDTVPRNLKPMLKYFYIIPDRFKDHWLHVKYDVPLFSEAEEMEWRFPLNPNHKLQYFTSRILLSWKLDGKHAFRVHQYTRMIELRRDIYYKLCDAWIENGGLFSVEEVKEALQIHKPAWRIIHMFQEKPEIKKKNIAPKKKQGRCAVPANRRELRRTTGRIALGCISASKDVA